MLKNIFKSMIFVSIIFCCFSNYLHATEQQKTLQSTDDSFVRNFVRKIENNKVSYDGKNLILYADPGSHTNGIFSLSFAICTIFGLACLSCNDQEVKVGGGLLALLCDTLCIIGLVGNSYYENENIPFITITNEGIKIWDYKKVKWNSICRLKYEKITTRDGIASSNDFTVDLCDDYLNSILTINDNKYLPITFDNLVAILEHYIEKNKQKLY